MLFFRIIHFNPAMSLSFTLAGALPPAMLVPYVIAQLLGSVTGAWLSQVSL